MPFLRHLCNGTHDLFFPASLTLRSQGSRRQSGKSVFKAALAGILTRNSIITPWRGDHSKMGGTDGKLSLSFYEYALSLAQNR